MYSGYAWPHSDMMASSHLRGHPHCTETCFLESLHASQGPHFCVEIVSLNFLLTDIWLSDSLCAHVTNYASSVFPVDNIAVAGSRVVPMTRWVCRWKPFWVPRGGTFQKAYLDEWEQEDDDQSYIPGEESKYNHRSRSVSRTTASESLQTVKDDGWSATRELPAPRCCRSLPQSSWQPLWRCKGTNKALEAYINSKMCSILRTLGHTSPFENPCSQFFSPKTVRHLSQAIIFAVS